MGMRRIIVIGSYNVGLTVLGTRIPRPGETVLGRHFDMGPGGKGSNQAVAIRRLGGSVAFVGRVGADSFGKDALAFFRSERLSTRFVTVDETHPTGAGIIFLDDHGQNAIGVAPGANHALKRGDIAKAASLFRAGDILLMQLECPIPMLQDAARRARRAGMTIILNPAPACPLEREFLQLCDYLTPNESEAALLSGVDVRDRHSAEKAGRRLLRRGAGCVVVTLGSKGALAVQQDGSTFVPARKVRAVDTTGAGDAFNAGFAFSLASRMSLGDALRFGCRVGAFCVTRIGVVPGLPREGDERWIRFSRSSD
jgi:ribokinase